MVMPQSRTGILFLIDTLDERGGTELFLFRLVTHLDPGFTIVVCPLQPRQSTMIEIMRQHGIEVIPLDLTSIFSLKALKQALALRKVIRTRGIRIVQTIHWGSDIYGALFKWFWRVSVLISSRRDLGFSETKRRHLILRRCTNWMFDCIVMNSMTMCDDLAAREGIPAQRLATIYNGIEPSMVNAEHISGKLRSSLGLASNDFVIGCVANIQPVKGIEFLIEAAGLLEQEGLSVRVLIIGGDGISRRYLADYYAKLDQLVENYHLDGKIRFLGLRDDVDELMTMMNVMVLPSLSEGFSNAVIEAMSAGIPVVATKVGGNAEAVIDGQTGYIVPPADAAALAAAIKRLASDPAGCKIMGEKARLRVREQFSIGRMVQAWEALYAKTVSGVEHTARYHAAAYINARN